MSKADTKPRREAAAQSETGITSAGKIAIADSLNAVIADFFALDVKTKNFHWHMTGPQFRDYHLLLDDQSGQVMATIDPAAERVRKLGQSTLRSVGQISRLQRIADNDAEMVAAIDMLVELRDDNSLLVNALRDVHNVGDRHNEVATPSLVENWIDEAEGRVWFLTETIGGNPMKVLINGVNIHVEERGNGNPALVFLHYYGGSSRTWRHVISNLAPRFRTIAIDHRGWGKSDAPAAGYGLSDLAADAEGVISALNLQSYILIGHSMGGKVAQLMASRRPAGLAALVLVAPAPPTPMIMPAQAREMMEGAYATRETVEAAIDNMLTAKPLRAADRAQVIEDSLAGAVPAKAAWPRTTSLEDIAAQIGDINVPTLIIAGASDRVDPPIRLQVELLPRIPQAVMHVLPGTGHLSMLESPDDVSALIRELCDGLKYSET